MGIAFAGNLLTLFLFYEALTLVTYPLVTHHGTDEARRGGPRLPRHPDRHLDRAAAAGASSAPGGSPGRSDFTPGGILAGTADRAQRSACLLALYMFGIGKAALMPVHRWLPAAMVAPTPVSALLHAVAVVKAGVFSVVKVHRLRVRGRFARGSSAAPTGWSAVAGFTIVAASVVALRPTTSSAGWPTPPSASCPTSCWPRRCSRRCR